MISFFKKNNYKRFNYSPIYSEKTEKRSKKIQFRTDSVKNVRKSKKTNLRLIFIIIILLLITYLILK